VKRVKWCIVPGLLVAIALFSFSLFQQRLQRLQIDPVPLQTQEEIEKTWNRPIPKKPIVSNTLVVCITGIKKSDFSSAKQWLSEIKPEAVQGVFTHANTYDEAYLLFQLLSGQKENLNSAHTMNNYRNTDHLDHLARYYKMGVSAYSSLSEFPLDNAVPVLEAVGKTGIPSGANQVTLLNIHADRDRLSQEHIKEWILAYEANTREGNITSQVLLCFFPDKNTEGISWIRNNTSSSPFVYWNSLPREDGNEIQHSPEPTIPIEDITTTLSYSWGLVPPVGCLGKPVFHWFPIQETETMDRFVYHADQTIFSSVFFLNRYQLDDAIIAGYLLEASDTIHATDSANLVELERRYQVIIDDFNSFHLYQQKKINVIPSLIFTLLALISLLVWLYNWLARYRPYAFGVLLFTVYVLLEQYVFPARLSLPAFSSLTLLGTLLSQLLFILPILTVLVVVYTLLAGYWFDISHEEICMDLNGIFISFVVCLLLFTATWVNRFGFIHLSMMPPLGVQQNQFHHFSLWILMPFLLAFSYGLSYGLTRILMALGPSHRQNS